MREDECNQRHQTQKIVRLPALRLPISCNTAITVDTHILIEAHILQCAYRASIAEQIVR
jgi:hypothetical protein